MDTKRGIGALIAVAVLMVTGLTSPFGLAARAEAPLATAPSSESPRRYSAQEIAELVAPVALYPDDLLAIVLPASTYPLQVVQAARFLDAAKRDRARAPDADWDASIVALLNYPEVLKRLSDQLDWTVDLGRAVLRQQPEVLAAVEGFRKRAHAAGNLRSDDRQVVTVNADTVVIRSTDPSALYVPDYDPTVVIVQRSRPVVRYYPRAYPVYYYAYPPEHVFPGGWFWGVTTYFTLGWTSQRVYVYPWDDPFHPYYGRPWLYEPRHYYYRRPPKVVHNHYYTGQTGHQQGDHNGSDRAVSGSEVPVRDDRTPWAGGSAEVPSDPGDPVPVPAPVGAPPTAREDPARSWRPDYELAGPRPGAEQPAAPVMTPSDSAPMPVVVETDFAETGAAETAAVEKAAVETGAAETGLAETSVEAAAAALQANGFHQGSDDRREERAEAASVSQDPAPIAAEALTTSQPAEQPWTPETQQASERPPPQETLERPEALKAPEASASEYQERPVEPAPRFESPAPRYEEPAPRYEEPGPRYEQPEPRYEEPAPRYEEPAPRFEEPAPRYETPDAVFERAEPRFERQAPVSEGPVDQSGWGGSGGMQEETDTR